MTPIATSTWSDALDRLGLAGVIHGLALRSGSGVIFGRAVTVKEIVGDYEPDAFAPASFLDALQPGSILVIDAGGAAISTFGGLAALAAVQAGAAGVVIDGACRDVADIRETGLWLASKHVTPRSGKRRIRIESVNASIGVCGIAVLPGDYIAGDETGIVRIPAARFEPARAIAEELTARDAAFADELRLGRSFRATSSKLGHV
jgi:regulator of RNase E activity RraA